MFGKKSRLCEILHTVIQRFCKGFDEGAAAGGAGLVQLHTVHRAVFDLDALHVLSADIQDAVHLRIEESGGMIMGYRFHLTVVQQESGLHQSLSVTGGAGAHDPHPLRQLRIDILNRADGGL